MGINKSGDRSLRSNKSLAARFLSLPILRKIAYRWFASRDVRISEGVGAGLWFNASGSNPEYALGTNELPVQIALSRYLKTGDAFYDIGANVGFFTVIAAHLVGPNGRVYAFEPLPRNIISLKRNIEKNGFSQARVYPRAVSNVNGQGELLVASYLGGSALSTASPPPDVVGTLAVDLVTLDSFLQEENTAPPAVIKIDVEGAEIEVLQGMSKTLQTYKPVLIYEIDDGVQEAYERKKNACESFLASLGYQVNELEKSYMDTGWLVGNFLAVLA